MKHLILPIRIGIYTGAILIAYFLTLSLFGKHTNPAFSLINAAITLFGVYEAVKISKHREASTFTYIDGFKIGVITGSTATIIFTLFFLIYATEINPNFLSELLLNMNWGFKSHIGLITFIVAIMGFSTTIVSSLTVMQLFKKSNNYIENV